MFHDNDASKNVSMKEVGKDYHFNSTLVFNLQHRFAAQDKGTSCDIFF